MRPVRQRWIDDTPAAFVKNTELKPGEVDPFHGWERSMRSKPSSMRSVVRAVQFLCGTGVRPRRRSAASGATSTCKRKYSQRSANEPGRAPDIAARVQSASPRRSSGVLFASYCKCEYSDAELGAACEGARDRSLGLRLHTSPCTRRGIPRFAGQGWAFGF